MDVKVSASGVEEALRRVRALRPLILAHQREADHLRRLPDEVARGMVSADLFRVLIPRDLGGWGLDPLTMYDLVEEMSFYDGAAGWNFAVCAGGIVICGALSPARAKEILSTPDCAFAASGAPGRAVAVEGGYLLSGKWAWASGIHHAKIVAGGAVIYDGDVMRVTANGAPQMRMCIVPKDKISILDAWDTGGMRGTGSTEWEAADLFIPETDACLMNGGAQHPDPVFNLPGSFFGFEISAVALGVARSAFEGLRDLAAHNAMGLRDQGYAQYAMAKSQALHESGHLNAKEAFRSIWISTQAGAPISMEQRARARRAYVHAVEASIEAVRLCCEAAGGAAVFERYPFARALRDVHAVHAHIVLSRRFMEMAGQAAFGLPIAHPIF
ncbi:MAG: acyl-CoA dehydrogenase family protein [Caulobacterales bacterium]